MLFFVSVYANYCLEFQDDFNQLDQNAWRHDNTLAGGGNGEFQWYTNNRTNSFVQNGILHLKPTLTADTIGEQKMLNGYTLDLGSQCNVQFNNGCRRTSNGQQIINPIQSANLRTINSHSIKYGKVEVRAKLPKGDWIWPAIWMLPKNDVYGGWPRSGEIDIMESRGNKPNNQPPGYDGYSSTLHWGPSPSLNRFYLTNQRKTFGTYLADEFHTYGLMWDENQIVTYLDNPSNVMLSVPLDDFYRKGGYGGADQDPWPTRQAPFDQEFYLILNVAVGGTGGYFPDNVGSKPWRDQSPTPMLDFWNNRNQWLPTWPNDNSRALQVDSVKMWRQC
ncbi:putative glucan binding protein [Gorgonomyces haynaldii]|nr:putative glucan binding protein [Gorgonomyces haynaldii]